MSFINLVYCFVPWLLAGIAYLIGNSMEVMALLWMFFSPAATAFAIFMAREEERLDAEEERLV